MTQVQSVQQVDPTIPGILEDFYVAPEGEAPGIIQKGQELFSKGFEDVYNVISLGCLVKDIFCPIVFFLVFVHIDCIEIKYPCCEQNNTHIDNEHVISIVLYHDFLLLFVGDISNVSD